MTNTAYIVARLGRRWRVSGSPTNLFVTQTVTFTDASTGSITNWVWSFGDGHSATNTTSVNVTNTYAAAGSYTVGLTVTGWANEHQHQGELCDGEGEDGVGWSDAGRREAGVQRDERAGGVAIPDPDDGERGVAAGGLDAGVDERVCGGRELQLHEHAGDDAASFFLRSRRDARLMV